MKKEIKVKDFDYIRDINDNIYCVRGYYHPKGKIIAHLILYKSKLGDRVIDNVTYKKYYTSDMRAKKSIPTIIKSLPITEDDCYLVPINCIKKVWKANSDYVVCKDVSFLFSLINKIGIKDNIGIAGSYLLGCQSADSDLDIVLYGPKNAHIFSNQLPNLNKFGFKSLDKNYLLKRYNRYLRLLGKGASKKFIWNNVVRRSETSYLLPNNRHVEFHISCPVNSNIINILSDNPVVSDLKVCFNGIIVNQQNLSGLMPRVFQVRNSDDGKEYTVITYIWYFKISLKNNESVRVKGNILSPNTILIKDFSDGIYLRELL